MRSVAAAAALFADHVIRHSGRPIRNASVSLLPRPAQYVTCRQLPCSAVELPPATIARPGAPEPLAALASLKELELLLLPAVASTPNWRATSSLHPPKLPRS